MHRHGAYPLFASASRCIKQPAGRASSQIRARSSKAPQEKPTPAALWSSSSTPAGPVPEKGRKTRKRDRVFEKKEKVDATSLAEKLVQLGERGDLTPTRTLRGEEMRLKDAIKVAAKTSRAGYQSKEKLAYFSQPDSLGAREDELASFLNIPPGSFIETRRNDMETLGIVLGTSTLRNQRVVVTMTSSGDLWQHRAADVSFIIPSYIPANLADRCGISEVPEDDRQLQARMQVLKRLREMIRHLEGTYNKMSKEYSDIYSRVRSPILDQWSETSVSEVVNMLIHSPTPSSIYATHRYLMNNSLHFVARDPYIISQTFDVRPKSEVREIEQVMEWKRMKDGPLEDFARRAMPVLATNRARLAQSSGNPPSMQTVKKNPWTQNDQVIIRFLLNSLRPTRSSQSDPYAIGQIAILRLLYPDAEVIKGDELYDALIDLGVISPWQDMVVMQKRHVPDPEPSPDSKHARKVEELVQRSLTNTISPSADLLGPEDFYPTDPLESVRHDFGEMRAYIIDDVTAKELDDAVSIEPVKGEKGTYWVHAHVANPTSVLPPTHAFAFSAMREGTSQYLTHRTIPLFPESLTHNSTSGWSLGSSLKNGKPSRVMTFSAKVNDNGDILDYRVRAGFLKNLKVASYDEVDKQLGYVSPVAITHPFGPPTAQLTREPPTFTEQERKELRLLDKVAGAFRRRRLKEGSVVMSMYTGDIQFGEFPAGSMTPKCTLREFEGFPEFTKYSVYSSDFAEIGGARSLVAEVMKIGSRVASRFGQDHKLPLIRRAMEPAVFLDDAAKEKALSLRSEAGAVPLRNLMPLVSFILPAEYTLEPKQHYALGVTEGEGYCRVTSPLRRALDLVTHWQLHHALLSGKTASHSPARPMFTKEWVERFMASYTVAERSKKSAFELHAQFWRLMFFKRWLNGQFRGMGGTGEVPPVPDTFMADVVSVPRVNEWTRVSASEVSLPEYGLRGILETRRPPAVGSQVKVKVSDIRLGMRPRITFVEA